MALNAFTRELGTAQGRLQPTGFVPVGGSLFAFVLGYDKPGTLAELNVGDYIEVQQTENLSGVNFVRFTTRLRPPASLPVGVGWKFALRVDGIERASQLLRPGRIRDHIDLAANVSKLSGSHTLGFRLEVM